jgi:cytoskeletal protein CcmA (bactofilin family)
MKRQDTRRRRKEEGEPEMNNSNIIRDEKGMALIFVTMTLAVAMLVIGPLLGFIGGSGRAAQIREDRLQGLYAADAGWELACYQVMEELPPPGSEAININVEDVNGNYVDVVLNEVANSTYKITSTATDFQGKTVVVESHLYATYAYFESPLFNNAITTDEQMNIKKDCTIDGSLHSNGDIGMDQGVEVSGNASAVGQISGGTVAGNRVEGAPPLDWPPEFNTQALEDEAMLNYFFGDYTVGSGPATIYLGPLYVDGNLHVHKDNTVVIEGPVYVAGSIQFDQNTTVEGTGAIVAESDINLNQMLASSPDEHLFVLSTSGNIQIDQTVNSRGLIYAPNGDVTFSQTAVFQGSVVGKNVTVNRDSTFTYERIINIWDNLPEDYSPNEVAILDYFIRK